MYSIHLHDIAVTKLLSSFTDREYLSTVALGCLCSQWKDISTSILVHLKSELPSKMIISLHGLNRKSHTHKFNKSEPKRLEICLQQMSFRACAFTAVTSN